MKRWILFLMLTLLGAQVAHGEEAPWFYPNRGQWNSKILYKVELNKGSFFIEKDQFTYDLNNIGEVYHQAHEGGEVEEIKHHTIHSRFVNSSWQGMVIESDTSDFYRNYFLGKNESKWVSKIHAFKKLRFTDFYPGIDLIVESTTDAIKYSFIVSAGADPSIIKIVHKGMDKLSLINEAVHLETRFGPIIESDLTVWNETLDNQQVSVRSQFKIKKDTVTYDFPDGYNADQRLIIDPSLAFSTFTGSTADNWGFTAAPANDNGDLVAGGIVFGTGYPISTGAYQSTWLGGYGTLEIDIGISKFSSDGSSLLYSTLLGGSGNETPNSIIANEQGELFILGVSTSDNYPVTSGAFQTVNNGGPTTTQIAIGFNGTDLILSKLSADGTALLGSTFMGGTKNDGLNVSALNYNYGDAFRGEVILDHNGNVLIASSSKSSDFPIINGSNPTIGGQQDGVVAKLTPDLSTMIWSTFIGGSQDDAAFSLDVSSANNVFVTGGTRSTNLSFPSGSTTSYNGGISDGFIAELDGNTSAILNGTYVGTSNYDQTFFVKLDLADRVYVFGQSDGNMPVSPGKYNNPNSGQFIQQYNADLSTLNWSTVVGGGNGVVEISPTAFLVSNCNEIYYAGWGGQTNQSVQATGSTSTGFPTTADAFQPSTNGNNFYVAVLSENANSLSYATFMGGTASSANHVDGGTSRFDKNGTIYHAVCAACGGNANGFTSTPGAFSETNDSFNCNMAAWKFDLGAIHSALSVSNPRVCIPDSIVFTNNSDNGNAYYWDFGDGTTSTTSEPTHFYDTPGTYTVQLIVEDTNSCFESDTSHIDITVELFTGGLIEPTAPICSNNSYQLEAYNGTQYEWSPAQYLDDPTSATPTATIDSTTVFTVIVSDSCGSDTLSTTLEVLTATTQIIDDQTICIDDSLQLWASGGNLYEWSATDPSSFISGENEDSVWVKPQSDMTYSCEIETDEGCVLTEIVFVEVYDQVPQPMLVDTNFLCKGDAIQVTASGAPTISWSPNTDINPTNGPVVTISTPIDRWYYVDFINPCGTIPDSIFIDVKEVDPHAGNDTIVCPGEKALLWASGGVSYSWTPTNSVSNPTDSIVVVSPTAPTTYTVSVTNQYGCTENRSVFVDHYSLPYLQVSPDYYGFKGDEVEMYAQGSGTGGTYSWSPTEYLSCVNCQDPTAQPPESMEYIVLYEDENGCRAEREVAIIFEGLIYVPNTFTPDGNGINDYFYAKGGNIKNFEMTIFNRWGELIYESSNLNEKWNGTYNDLPCPDGTYIWKISYEDFEYNKEDLVGHVNLLR